MEQKYAITVDDLTVAYDYKPVLWDIDLAIPESVLMCIVGPNGAGKSTLIKAILGIIKPIARSVSIFGKPYEKQRSLVAYVPQKQQQCQAGKGCLPKGLTFGDISANFTLSKRSLSTTDRLRCQS